MNWNYLTELSQLEKIDDQSEQATVVIFKHSTRCSISATALDRLERQWEIRDNIIPYFLDLLSYRDISNAISNRYGIRHESPQILMIRDRRCVFSQSHMDINPREILSHS